MMTLPRLHKYLLGLCAALQLAGCAVTSELPSRVLFPIPPDPARFEFIGVYSSSDDMLTSRAAQFRKSFLGSTGADHLVFPTGVATDRQGRLFVSDSRDHNIKVFDFAKKTVNYLLKEPSLGLPSGIAFDAEDRLYVADSSAGYVVVYAAGTARIERTLTTPELVRPVFVAVNDRNGRVYVTDGKIGRVFVFDKSGTLLFKFGEGDAEGKGELFGPQGIAVAANGDLYVAEIFNARISIFDADGKYLRSFGERGDSIWTFDHPKGIAIDRDGALYISDARRGRVVVYNQRGELLMALGDDAASYSPLGFLFPVGVNVDARGRLYVADAMAARISAWQLLTPDYLRERPITAKDLKEIEDFFKKQAAKP